MIAEILMFWLAVQDAVTGPPLPTKEQVILVEKMGHGNFLIREKANRELEKMGYKALRVLRTASSHRDTEIARRAQASFNKYFIIDEEYPSIWFMDNKLRWPDGEFANATDVAKYYYYITSERPIVHWNEVSITEKATKNYVRDLFWMGKSKEDIEKIVKKMTENVNTMYNKSRAYSNQNGQYIEIVPPGRLELIPDDES